MTAISTQIYSKFTTVTFPTPEICPHMELPVKPSWQSRGFVSEEKPEKQRKVAFHRVTQNRNVQQQPNWMSIFFWQVFSGRRFCFTWIFWNRTRDVVFICATSLMAHFQIGNTVRNKQARHQSLFVLETWQPRVNYLWNGICRSVQMKTNCAYSFVTVSLFQEALLRYYDTKHKPLMLSKPQK